MEGDDQTVQIQSHASTVGVSEGWPNSSVLKPFCSDIPTYLKGNYKFKQTKNKYIIKNQQKETKTKQNKVHTYTATTLVNLLAKSCEEKK